MSKFTLQEKKFLKEAFFAGWRRYNPVADPTGIEKEFYIWLDHEAYKLWDTKYPKVPVYDRFKSNDSGA